MYGGGYADDALPPPTGEAPALPAPLELLELEDAFATTTPLGPVNTGYSPLCQRKHFFIASRTSRALNACTIVEFLRF